MKVNGFFGLLMVYYEVGNFLTGIFQRAEVPSLTEVLDQGWPVSVIVDFSVNPVRVSIFLIALPSLGSLFIRKPFLTFAAFFVLFQQKLQFLHVFSLVLALENGTLADVVPVMLEF